MPPAATTVARTDVLLTTVWALPVPATLQDAEFRLVDVNPAFTALVGRPRQLLLGRDPVTLTPPEDQPQYRAEQRDAAAATAPGATLAPMQRRLIDGTGRERWFTLLATRLASAGPAPRYGARPGAVGSSPLGGARWLTLWHEITAEVAAREQARRAQDELAQWFELSGTGMLVYDDSGLIVRCNAAFEVLVEQVPDTLGQAAPDLQALLGWRAGDSGRGDTPGALLPSLVPGAPAIEHQIVVRLQDGGRRRLSARLACHAGEQGERRVMAVVQDRSAEDERDLAQLEMGMLMDTTSVGVATYDPALGWLAPTPAAPRSAPADGMPVKPAAATSGALLGIRRELVEPESLPDYERLQRALRSGERTEVRYAVRHPELGPRWLLTRVEPGALAGGRTTTSVVTLDVTDQERAQRRNDQLLRELTTILDSSTAGIAYLRGPVLVRCNRRFERMLGFEAGAAAGATLEEIFARSIGALQGAREALDALAAGQPFETELQLATADPDARTTAPVSLAGLAEPVQPRWYSLSVRRAQVNGEQAEAVAVLTDITRLKTQQSELEQLLRDRELMFSLSEVGIVYQRGARIERANQAMATLTGWASPELTTLDAAELYADARACVEFEARITQALRAQGRFSGERLLRRRDGQLLWVQVAVRPVQPDSPDSGAEAGVICSFVDIDERRRARETLALQAERTRAILNSVLVGIVTVSEDGIQWMNRSARRMFSGELADFVGEPMSIVATAEPDHPLRRTDYLQRLQEGESETFECRMKGRDGREFWVVGNAVLTGHAHDGGRELTIALLDIERRRQAEVSIAQAQASLQRVIETAPLAIALFDAQTLRVQQLNQTASSFFGRPLQLALGGTPEEINAPDKAAALRGWLQGVAASGLASQHEWKEAGPDEVAAPASAGDRADVVAGGKVWDCRIAPLDDGGPAGAQLLLVASDVTGQRAAERARLRAAIDQREVLVREVHHRIKNNLQGVAGLLQQNAVRHPELAGALNEAVGQVQAIAQVYGLQVGASGPIVVASLLRAIATSVQRTFGRSIVVDVQGAVPHLLPEAESIPVALTVNELLTNAIKHSHVDGSGSEVRCTLLAVAVAVGVAVDAVPPGAGAGVAEAVQIRIASRALLPPGFDLNQVRGGVSGLGLVRALLPRRSATLSLQQDGADVVATVELRPPGVRVPEPGAAPLSGPQSAPQSAP